ncbi:MAG: DUF1830 domain-containing protein [Leptolyngbyaceae cyanobacterium bins.302]|nr:DUF1830 domain-containing protein [Leptolyngbyaceae cyanobacterium bins.302]
MISTVSSPPPDLPDRILCYYINTTAHLQKACISGISRVLFEQVVFPLQRILFEASPEALLEIHSCSSSGETILQRIPCLQLRVSQPSLPPSPSLPPIAETDSQTTVSPTSAAQTSVSQTNLANE